MAGSALEDFPQRQERPSFPVRMVACTKTDEIRVCQLSHHLSNYNSLLWHLGVQLRELYLSDFGSVHLVSVREVHSVSPGDGCRTEAQRVAEELLERLLNSHKCLTAIDLQGFGANECCDFFRTVAASNTLQRVIIRNITVFKDLREAFSQIDSSLLSRKVLIDDLHVRPLNIPALPQCTLVTAVTLELQSH
ncbi:hypothetical protein MTO96_052296 [Rhipicephalus appendiculatus]